LGHEKLLSDFNLDEYCICVVENRRRASTAAKTGVTMLGASVGMSAAMVGSKSTFGGPAHVGTAGIDFTGGGGGGGRTAANTTASSMMSSIPHSNSAGNLAAIGMGSGGGRAGGMRSRSDADQRYSEVGGGGLRGRGGSGARKESVDSGDEVRCCYCCCCGCFVLLYRHRFRKPHTELCLYFFPSYIYFHNFFTIL
jgi:hypothetical protein